MMLHLLCLLPDLNRTSGKIEVWPWGYFQGYLATTSSASLPKHPTPQKKLLLVTCQQLNFFAREKYERKLMSSMRVLQQVLYTLPHQFLQLYEAGIIDLILQHSKQTPKGQNTFSDSQSWKGRVKFLNLNLLCHSILHYRAR